MEGVPTRAPTVVPKGGLGGEESPGLVRQSVDAAVRRERGWPSRPESCAASLLSWASNMRAAPLQFPRRSSLGTTSRAMEIHQCLLGPFDGCNAGPDQSKRNATTADARCALRTKRRAGAHTDRARLKRLLPEELRLLLCPLAPRLSAQRLLGHLDRQKTSIPTTSDPIHLPHPLRPRRDRPRSWKENEG